MAKLKDVICYGVAALLSVLTFAWFALDGWTVKIAGTSTGVSVWDLLGEELTGSAKTSIIFAIISLVVVALLAVACVLGILNHYGKVKLSWISWVAIGLAAALVVTTVVAMACMASFAKSPASVGVGLILPVVCSVLALVATGLTKLKLGK